MIDWWLRQIVPIRLARTKITESKAFIYCSYFYRSFLGHYVTGPPKCLTFFTSFSWEYGEPSKFWVFYFMYPGYFVLWGVCTITWMVDTNFAEPMMTSLNENSFLTTGLLCGEFTGHAQRPVTRSFAVFFDLRLNKRLSKQSWGWWF